MAPPRSKILNFGASVVTYAEFSQAASSLRLEAIHHERLNYDISSNEGWLEASRAAVKSLIQRHKLSGRVDLIFPGYQLLTKNLKVPHVEEAKRAQVIAFNAQSNIPYALHEVSWDSQVVGDDGVELEVLFIAVKKQILENFCREMSTLGLEPMSVDAASILDYNAFRYAYPEHTGETLIINVGAKSSNLLFVSPEGFFIRNIALGGNVLTQSIADAMGKVFVEAESLKLEYFSRGEGEPANELIDQKAADFNRRMSQEITRSIISYRQQKKGKSPGLILLTGGGSQLPGLAEFLLENQRTQVEFFNPTTAIEIGSKVNEDSLNAGIFRFGELLGKTVRTQVEDSVGINLLPQDIRRNIDFSKKKPWFLGAAALIAIAPTVAFLQGMGQDDGIDAALGQVQRELPARQSLNRQINDKIEEANRISGEIQRYDSLLNSKSNWIAFFAELQGGLFDVRDVWLDEIRVERVAPAAGAARAAATGPSLNLPEGTVTLRLRGRLLLRDGSGVQQGVDERTIENRIRTLQQEFEASEFIDSTATFRIDFAAFQAGTNLLPFEFVMVQNPERRL